MSMSPEVLQKRLDRAQAKLAAMETLIEDRTREVYHERDKADRNSRRLDALIRALPEALLVVNDNMQVAMSNQVAAALLGYEMIDLIDCPVDQIVRISGELKGATVSLSEGEHTWYNKDGTELPVWTSVAKQHDSERWVIVGRDLRERKRLEGQLLHSSKLESVGQLASGIAHEINTPIQFVMDSMHFIKESVEDMMGLLDVMDEHQSGLNAAAAEAYNEAKEDADLDFLKTELPSAVDRSLNGLKRIVDIVKSMKSFAHPGGDEAAWADINQALRDTACILQGEVKHHADLNLKLDEQLPQVMCRIGELNQVFLNILVNASHAIESLGEGRGVIDIVSQLQGEEVAIIITDNGGGIPEDVIERIFDPFFTTKEVGKGTGQGLAIAHGIIADQHGGSLQASNHDKGARFEIRLPVKGCHA